MKSGFTFLEVLIALLVTTILFSVACSSLITALKAEQTANWQRDATLLISQITCAERLGLETTGIVSQTDGAWEINTDDIQSGEAPNAIAWHVWILYPREQPSLTVIFSTRK